MRPIPSALSKKPTSQYPDRPVIYSWAKPQEGVLRKNYFAVAYSFIACGAQGWKP